MSYVPQTWNDDDPATPLSAARLAHMETGIELIDTHLSDTVDAHDASAISVAENGNNVSVSVQASLVAIDAAKIEQGDAVDLTSAQTVGGVKAFSSSPTVPTPTTASQVAPKSYVDSLLGPSGTVTLGADQIFTGKNQFRGVFVTNEVLDIRDTRFAGGAPCNGVDDDQPAFQALIDSGIGDQTIGRAGRVTLPGKNLVLKSPVTIRRKAVAFEGAGWSPATGGGTTIDYKPTGTDNRAMFIFQEQFGSSMKNIRFRGNTDSTKRPIAAIQLDAPSSGTVQYNTGFVGERLWFGRYSGHDDPAVALGTGEYLTNGILTSGVNIQNDMSEWTMCFFSHCTTGVRLGNSQAVGHNLQNCKWYDCGTGVNTDADITLINPYFAHSKVTDLQAYIARVLCINYESEFAYRMAVNTDAAEFDFYHGYFQVGTSLATDGHIIKDINDTRTVLKISDFDFRENQDHADAVIAASRSAAKIAVQVSQVGPIPHKHIQLEDVNWGIGGVRQNFGANRLDVNPRTGDITIFGHLQGAPDASQHGKTVEIYNVLDLYTTTVDFARNDREMPVRVKAGAPLDADYVVIPRNGTQVLDSSSNRLYVRVGGVWRYTTLT